MKDELIAMGIFFLGIAVLWLILRLAIYLYESTGQMHKQAKSYDPCWYSQEQSRAKGAAAQHAQSASQAAHDAQNARQRERERKLAEIEAQITDAYRRAGVSK